MNRETERLRWTKRHRWIGTIEAMKIHSLSSSMSLCSSLSCRHIISRNELLRLIALEENEGINYWDEDRDRDTDIEVESSLYLSIIDSITSLIAYLMSYQSSLSFYYHLSRGWFNVYLILLHHYISQDDSMSI